MAQLTINGQDAVSTGVSLFFLDHEYNIKLLEIEELDHGATTTNTAQSLKDRANAIIIKMKEVTDMA
jgi:hypothetical protein